VQQEAGARAAELGDVRHRLEQAQDQMRQMGVGLHSPYGVHQFMHGCGSVVFVLVYTLWPSLVYSDGGGSALALW
jgi:hypothetical protein